MLAFFILNNSDGANLQDIYIVILSSNLLCQILTMKSSARVNCDHDCTMG